MPTKVIGTKDAEHIEAHRLRNNPLVKGTPAEIAGRIDELQTIPQLREAVKVLSQTVALLLESKI